MDQTVKLSRVQTVLLELEYPITRNDAAVEFEDITVLLADGEANLGKLVSETGSDTFGSMDELEGELFSVLPVEAIGEPGQSEGDA